MNEEAKKVLARLKETIPPGLNSGVRVQAADTIERLIRERDEARVAFNAQTLIAEAEAEGYRRGVEDAAKAIQAQKEIFKSPQYAVGPLAAFSEVFACDQCEKAILALLEQTEPSLSPEDKPT